jgi:hypothetical protein
MQEYDIRTCTNHIKVDVGVIATYMHGADCSPSFGAYEGFAQSFTFYNVCTRIA